MKVVVIGVDGRAKSVERRMQKEGHEAVLVHTLDDADLVLKTIETFGQPDLIVATRIETSAYGIVDRLRNDGYTVFGVSKEHSQIETSKAYGKTTASGMGM